jgi:cytochrome c peroxidase
MWAFQWFVSPAARWAMSRKILFAAVAVGVMATAARAQLGPPPQPAENPVTPAKVALGKALFWDEQLSSDNTVACGTCHRPAQGGADARFVALPGPDGIAGTSDDMFGSPGVIRADAKNAYEPDPQHAFAPQVTGRNSPSFLHAAWADSLFWDGRAGTTFVDPQSGAVSIATGGALESQVVGPPVSSVEMAHAGRAWNEIVAKIEQSRPLVLATALPPDLVAALAVDPTYPELFATAFGDAQVTAERIAWAIASYERSLLPDETAWDRFQRGDSGALTASQQRGAQLFNGKAKCDKCHALPLGSDDSFHNIGLRDPATDPGRAAITGNPADRGKFRTPSVRDVALHPRFMHSGQFTTLDEVIDFYERGGDFSDNIDPFLNAISLSQQERADLLDFLVNGLVDPRVATGSAPFDRPTLWSERSDAHPLVYGDGWPGSGGFVPHVLATTPANVGNPDYKFGLHDALGGRQALTLVAAAPAAPGATLKGVPLHVDLAQLYALLLLPTLGDGPGGGYASIVAGLPADPAIVGMHFYVQWFVFDPDAVGRIAATSGVDYEIF